MKLFLLTLVLIVVVGVGYFSIRLETPHGAFERHFGSGGSGSVSQIAVFGRAALAGSDEVLTFSIADEDLKAILKQRGFSEVTQLVKDKRNTGISASEWDKEIENAESLGIKGSEFYEIVEFDGLVRYVLISDQKTDRVYYHYFKT